MAQSTDVAIRDRIERLRSVGQRLRAVNAVDELLAVAAAEAVKYCAFNRALVLTIDEGRFSARGVGTVPHSESDDLRRTALAKPVRLESSSDEAEAVRRPDRARGLRRDDSLLVQQLELEHAAAVALAPDDRVLALLVLDRSTGQVGEDDLSAIDLLALYLGPAIARVALHVRLGEVAREVRHLTASANALVHEATSAPLGLTSDYGLGPVFSATGMAPASETVSVEQLLSGREREIAALLVRGKSNRAIADELYLSPETVKAHVARLLRKLGASNRVEAVSRYLELVQDV